MKSVLSTVALAVLVILAGSFGESQHEALLEKGVVEVLESLGEDYSAKRPRADMPGVSAELGEQIFHTGEGKVGKWKSKQQSRFFVCTACHNTEREDPDLSKNDAQARLIYSDRKGIPFLPGTTMYGAVNRETYYNDDYINKYGPLVEDARDDIRKAIQLCATECSQGRPLEDYELESMLAYLWTLSYKIKDLDLPPETLDKLENLSGEADRMSLITTIKDAYLHKSAATFIPPPEDRTKGNGLTGDPRNGEKIYVNSCMHCHFQGRYSYLHLDTTAMTLNYLKGKVATYHPHSVYQVIRWGIGSHFMNKAYMPNYTEERLSEQQLADLVAYLQGDR